MPDALPLVLLFAAGTLTSAVMTGLVRRFLVRRALFDMPNHRSSHQVPTPRGGGLAVAAVLIVLLPAAALLGPLPPGAAVALPGALLLAGLSWLDDLRDLSARLRFSVHMLAVAAGLAALPADQLVLQGLLPWWADRLLAFLAWIWFVNLYNFMDGIDGISGSETLCLCLGLLLVAPAAGLIGGDLLAVAMAGAVAGFLWWNWPPAKIFLGDVGSVPLGYLLGWLLLSLAAHGAWAAALILPSYYLADATITLTRRALRGEKVWQAHREHFYQRAARGVGSHKPVVLTILAGNLALVALAVASLAAPLPAMAGGIAVTSLLLWRLTTLAKPARRPQLSN